jgi:hypothetical protein
VVDVDHQAGERTSVAVRNGNRLGGPLVEPAPVREPGEAVGAGRGRESFRSRLRPECHTHARGELGRVERLHDVVDGAAVEPLDACADVGVGGQEDHRRSARISLLETPADCVAV